MSNNNQRPWYRTAIIIPAIAVILAAIIGVMLAPYFTPPTTPVFRETIGEIDTDGNYEISWKESRRATHYILLEDRDSSFTNPRTIDTNSETRGRIYGKSNGDYHYRVRACNDAGESEWSPIRKITVIISTPSTLPPTQTSAPTSTPTPCIIDTMDSTLFWTTDIDDTGSSINIESVSGRTGKAIEISYDLKERGWVRISKKIDPEILSEKEEIKFFYTGSGTPNTIELKLIYGDVGGTTFGILSNRATVTDDWVSFEVPYTHFDCWWPEDNCILYGNELDLNKVRKIEFAISNKPEEGDVYGSGIVIIDDVQAITP